ncbi:MAG TPA: polyphosphate kinase 2 [Caulobacter sp.]|nr:polyphosphate kinase 2 [Caulobacter sp.]
MTDKDDYEAELIALQTAIVAWRRWSLEAGEKVLVIFEGRDAAGKDGSIKRIVEHLPPRTTPVIALPKPSDRERTQWYFQRYVPHLPAAGDFVLFNRSWYNRAGVERVMEFATGEEVDVFLREVPHFEAMLVDSGVKLIKLWLDVSKAEQAERIAERRKDPLKLLKISPLDAEAQKRWDAYSEARDAMLTATHSDDAPWVCVRSDSKKKARLAIMRHLLHELAPAKLRKGVEKPDPAVLFKFDPSALSDGRLER